ncbi:hypothetical protein KKF25_02890, partial [Patescibacteria group bacterium]|nr:hypothetical protein [Patescibacteria group bacterium]
YPSLFLPLIKGRRRIVKLFVAKDKQKDQSYFLYRLSQEQLDKINFPLGEYTKEEVYKLAQKWRLPHQAHQSFDVCFAGDYQGFLKKYLELKPGKIVRVSNSSQPPLNLRGGEIHPLPPFTKEGGIPPLNLRGGEGELLGQHAGLPFYTIGQRASIGGPGPFFVVQKDVKKNILYVSNNERDLYKKEMLVEKVNWVVGRALKLPLRCKVKIRYQAEAVSAVIASVAKQSRTGATVHGIAASSRQGGTPRNDLVGVSFARSQRAITPGQSAVFYGRGGEVLGGGMIL